MTTRSCAERHVSLADSLGFISELGLRNSRRREGFGCKCEARGSGGLHAAEDHKAGIAPAVIRRSYMRPRLSIGGSTTTDDTCRLAGNHRVGRHIVPNKRV